jgi:Flp pilus assembly protein TadD
MPRPGRDLRPRIAAIGLALLFTCVTSSWAAALDKEICDVNADLVLGLENYPAAIVLHRKVLRAHKDNALAHYHLGFAYGMTGRSSQEISEYLKAVSMGLREWDLFLNLGIAYLDQGDYSDAVDALETSVSLGAQRPEAHFNLALAYEKADRLGDAMKEIIASLRFAPADPDMRNTKAIICAESGDLQCAHDEWALLLQVAPNYAPARANLTILMGAAPESRPSLPNMVEIPQLLGWGS